MTDDRTPRFESILEELGTVVERLESGQIPLDEALALYERGVGLARTGNQLLDGAEAQIKTLQQSLNPEDVE